MKKILLFLLTLAFVSCNTNAQDKKDLTITTKAQTKAVENKKQEKKYPVMKSEKEWKAQLTEMEYYVLREKGTERAFTGKYYNYKGEGTYVCAACGIELYESKYKYNSGTGWPSFDRGFDKNLEYEKDTSFGMVRTEVICANCGGHLGHVFNDGPQNTTGKRHCLNSVSLQFIASNAPK